MIDYTSAADALRKVAALPATLEADDVRIGQRERQLIYSEQLRLLEQYEAMHTRSLERAGLSHDAAASAAVSFMSQVLARCAPISPA